MYEYNRVSFYCRCRLSYQGSVLDVLDSDYTRGDFSGTKSENVGTNYGTINGKEKINLVASGNVHLTN